MKIETVQDLNHGIPYTTKITVQGETISNYTGHARAGAKFKKDLSRIEIAKLMREDIKVCGFTKKNGFVISVTCESYSGGGSIDIRVKQAPFKMLSQEYLDWDSNNRIGKKFEPLPYGVSEYTVNGKLLMDTLEHIHSSYRYSDCDGMIDYFDTNYYGHVDLDWDLRKKEGLK